MKNTIAILTLLFSANAFTAPNPETLKAAVESFSTCQNFIRFDNEFVFNGVGRQLLVRPVSNPEQQVKLPLTASSVDVVRINDQVFVLTELGIEEWTLSNQRRIALYPSSKMNRPFAYQENPTGFALYGTKLFISHGRLGVSIFDTVSKKIENQIPLVTAQLPLESMANGIATIGNLGYIAMDNFTLVRGDKPPLRGLVIINLDTQAIVSELDGMDPGVDAIVSDSQRLIVSFMGQPIWKYNVGKLNGRSMPAPERRVFNFPELGHPTGKPSLDSKYYYTCFSSMEDSNFGKRSIRVWTKKQLQLD